MAGTTRGRSAVLRGEQLRDEGYLPIEDDAAIGDGRTLALVGIDGSIDWMCLPNLDSPSVFAALLDPAGGGSFSLAPAIPYQAERRYLPRTNVARTEYTTDAGRVGVIDAVTIDGAQDAPWRELVREVEGLGGAVPMGWRFHPRFDYGRSTPGPTKLAGAFLYRHGGLQLALSAWDAGNPAWSRGPSTVASRSVRGSGPAGGCGKRRRRAAEPRAGRGRAAAGGNRPALA